MHSKLFAVILAIALTLSLSACGHKEDKSAEAKPLPEAEVRVEVLKAGQGTQTFQTVGRVKNVRESVIASKVMGQVREVRVSSGDAVKQGQILMRIDERDTAGQLAQAEGALAQANAAFKIAETNKKRYEQLLASKSVSQAEFDQANYQYQNAKGAVEQARGAVKTARSYLRETKVEAPYDGVVVDTMIEQGEMVAPGRPLLRVEGSGQLEFETTVAESDVAGITVAQAITVILESGNREVPANVSEISPSADAGTHSTVVRALLEEKEGIRSGMFGRARFPLAKGKSDGIRVPKERIVRNGQLEAVYIVDASDHVRLRLIRAGRSVGDHVDVLSGLKDGARIVTSDTAELIDGQPAKILD